MHWTILKAKIRSLGFLVFDAIKTIKKEILTDCNNSQEMCDQTEQKDEENSLLFGTSE